MLMFFSLLLRADKSPYDIVGLLMVGKANDFSAAGSSAGVANASLLVDGMGRWGNEL